MQITDRDKPSHILGYTLVKSLQSLAETDTFQAESSLVISALRGDVVVENLSLLPGARLIALFAPDYTRF